MNPNIFLDLIEERAILYGWWFDLDSFECRFIILFCQVLLMCVIFRALGSTRGSTIYI